MNLTDASLILGILYYSWNCNNNREMASLTFKRSVIHRNRVKFCSFIAMNSY